MLPHAGIPYLLRPRVLGLHCCSVRFHGPRRHLVQQRYLIHLPASANLYPHSPTNSPSRHCTHVPTLAARPFPAYRRKQDHRHAITPTSLTPHTPLRHILPSHHAHNHDTTVPTHASHPITYCTHLADLVQDAVAFSLPLRRWRGLGLSTPQEAPLLQQLNRVLLDPDQLLLPSFLVTHRLLGTLLGSKKCSNTSLLRNAHLRTHRTTPRTNLAHRSHLLPPATAATSPLQQPTAGNQHRP